MMLCILHRVEFDLCIVQEEGEWIPNRISKNSIYLPHCHAIKHLNIPVAPIRHASCKQQRKHRE